MLRVRCVRFCFCGGYSGEDLGKIDNGELRVKNGEWKDVFFRK